MLEAPKSPLILADRWDFRVEMPTQSSHGSSPPPPLPRPSLPPCEECGDVPTPNFWVSRIRTPQETPKKVNLVLSLSCLKQPLISLKNSFKHHPHPKKQFDDFHSRFPHISPIKTPVLWLTSRPWSHSRVEAPRPQALQLPAPQGMCFWHHLSIFATD